MDKRELELNEDLVYLISEYLPITMLKDLEKAFSVKIKENILINRFTNKIEEKLNKLFGDKYLEMKDILIKEEALLSGSFILQVIYDEEYENSDIDIYIPCKNKNYPPHPCACIDEPFTELEDFLYNLPHNNEIPEHRTWNYGGDNHYISSNINIKYVRNYKYNKVMLQIIHVDVENKEILHENIINTFDYDICKNTYDFTNKIQFYKLEDVLNKKTKFKFGNNGIMTYSETYDPDVYINISKFTDTFYRFFKYKERGIEFYSENTEKNIIKKYINMIKDKNDEYQVELIEDYYKIIDKVCKEFNIKIITKTI
jgi:hypothetical protein